jgi:hypothetical protein
MGSEGEAPLDQRSDDGRSLIFDSEPLREDVEILGVPEVLLRLRSDRPNALLAVRINDVAADGGSSRVTFGVLNLTHRDSHEHPEALPPGETVTVRIGLNAIAHRFPTGHVIRLALSTAYWPMVWPSAQAATLELDTGGCSLDLPLRPPDPLDESLPAFAPVEDAGLTSTCTQLGVAGFRRSIERDLVGNEVVYRMISEGGDFGSASMLRIEDIGLDLGHHVEHHFRIDERDPLSASAECSEQLTMRRDQWQIQVNARTRLSATREHFLLQAWLSASEGADEVFSREWQEKIERDLV